MCTCTFSTEVRTLFAAYAICPLQTIKIKLLSRAPQPFPCHPPLDAHARGDGKSVGVSFPYSYSSAPLSIHASVRLFPCRWGKRRVLSTHVECPTKRQLHRRPGTFGSEGLEIRRKICRFTSLVSLQMFDASMHAYLTLSIYTSQSVSVCSLYVLPERRVFVGGHSDVSKATLVTS